jgi:hypothetical protein
MENLAQQLLAGEPGHIESVNSLDHAIRACEKLRVPLTKLAGASGFSSLMSRALALAKRRSPALAQLQVGADGSLTVIKENAAALETAEAAQQGGVILISELLALLVTLIGEPLTLSLVRERWPEVPKGTTIPKIEEQP